MVIVGARAYHHAYFHLTRMRWIGRSSNRTPVEVGGPEEGLLTSGTDALGVDPLCCSVVIKADGTSDFPRAIFELPERDEPALAGRSVGFGMMEAMNANLDRAIAFYVMRLQAARDQFSADVTTADVPLDAFDELFLTQSLIVIELDIIREEGGKLF